jgi:hypothetical protein
MTKGSQESARDTLAYELGNMFATRLRLEELIPLVISKCREVLEAGGVSVLDRTTVVEGGDSADPAFRLCAGDRWYHDAKSRDCRVGTSL